MSKDEKKFQCGIVDYLEKHHKEAYVAVKELCMGGALKARKDSGVTFIVPDSAVLKTIMTKAYSDKESDVEEAISMMQAHILNDCYEKIDELKVGDVSNRLNQKVAFESIAAGTATVKGGPKLTVDGGFKLMPKRSGAAILLAAGGPMPTNGEPAPRRERKPRAEGERRMATGRAEFDRVKAVKDVEMAYVEKNDGGACYLHKVLAIMKHLEEKHKDSADYKRALVSLDYTPFASLYLLLEPYRTVGPRLLSDEVLDGCEDVKCDLNGEAAVKKYLDYLSAADKLLGENLDEKVDHAKWEIIQNGISRQKLPKSIGMAYSSAESYLYNDESLKTFFNAAVKEWQDLARFHINYMVTYFESPIGNHRHDSMELFSSIQAIMGSDERYSTKVWPAVMSTEDFLAGPVAFVESGSFLYYPGEKKHSGAGEDANDLYNGKDGQVMAAAEAGTGALERLRASAGCCN